MLFNLHLSINLVDGGLVQCEKLIQYEFVPPISSFIEVHFSIGACRFLIKEIVIMDDYSKASVIFATNTDGPLVEMSHAKVEEEIKAKYYKITYSK